MLTEVPEMFGAERILMSRCRDEATFEKTVHMVNDFKQYFIAHDQPIYENPSPGNKAGGITTLEEKSLGCTQKAGQSKVVDVLKYGERLHTPGLNLLSARGMMLSQPARWRVRVAIWCCSVPDAARLTADSCLP